MIDELRLINFKAARDIKIRMSELTLLAGLNGSGKSTVLQSLGLLRQSTFSGMDALHLQGRLVELGRARDVRHVGAATDQITFEVSAFGDKVEVHANAADDESDVLPIEIVGNGALLGQTVGGLNNFQFIQADRMVPQSLYRQAFGADRVNGWLGCRGEFAVDYLSAHAEDRVPSGRHYPKDALGVSQDLYKLVAPLENLEDQVSGWMQQLSPGVRVKAYQIPSSDSTRLSYQYMGAGPNENASRPVNVGFGLTYSIAILVACLSAKSGSLLLIENPEAHLHPQGQVAMGLLLAACAADGVQVIVETHSDHVLNGIRLAVKNESLLPNKVKLCYFSRDVELGACTIENPAVEQDGQLTNWPRGFFDQWERSLDELLR
ncbi:DUF3696 domain-containing protein [Paraburkholderia aspalathi]|uniref:DUF3696 domain-containing protein n=1 Tax=Paraburkholderia nemoris TaxID=2793076 RepID=A0ABN7KQK5_9BURK|nr:MULTISPECIES: DUF3696 domain-containing protein [Paraburkholderia]MBK3808941.1 DUF3696 domain-containing protein [Paraburkholderia aspalathi]CAE6706032.1 hypothetical protein R69776_00870 [Paraburkholderia nemoris]